MFIFLLIIRCSCVILLELFQLCPLAAEISFYLALSVGHCNLHSLPSPPPLFPASFITFLLFETIKCSTLILYFPWPSPRKTKLLRKPVSFYWRGKPVSFYFETKIGALDLLITIRSVLLVSLKCQNQEMHEWILNKVHTDISIFIYIYLSIINLNTHELIFLSLA